jgi:cytoskeletal protein CcmA (bactofilin family)
MKMKTTFKFLTLLVLMAFLVMPTGSVLAKGLEDGKVVFGDSYTLQSGDTLSGDLVVLGGAVEIQTDATVEGNIVVMGGSMQVDGKVEGDVVMIGGTVSLGSNAVVEGNAVTVGGSLQRMEGAQIKGEIINTSAPMINIGNGASIPPLFDTPFSPEPPRFDINFNPLWAVMRIFGQAFLMGLLAALIVAFIPMPTQRVAQAIATQPVVAGGLGCLTVIVAPVALVFLGLLTLTVILAPLTISLIGISAILLAVALIFGEIAIGLEVGQRLVKSFHAEWPLPLSAAMGTFLTVLVTSAVGSLLWCFGWWAPILLALLSVGGVIMTRFGTRTALPPMVPVSGPVAPVAMVNPPDAPLPPAS